MAYNFQEALKRAKKIEEEKKKSPSRNTALAQQIRVSQDMQRLAPVPAPVPAAPVSVTAPPQAMPAFIGRKAATGLGVTKAPVDMRPKPIQMGTMTEKEYADYLIRKQANDQMSSLAKMQALNKSQAYNMPISAPLRQNDQAYKQMIKQEMEDRFNTRPTLSGFIELANPLGSTEKLVESNLGIDIDTEKARGTAQYKVGAGLGIGSQFLTPYAAVGGALRGTRLAGVIGNGIAKAAPKASGKAVGKVSEALAKDLLISPAVNTNIALNNEGLRGKEAVKSIALNTALDVGLSGAFEAVPAAVKGLKGAKKTDIVTGPSGKAYRIPNADEIKATVNTDGSVVIPKNYLKDVDSKDLRAFVKAYANKNYVTSFGANNEMVDPKMFTIKQDGKNVIITKTGVNDTAKSVRGQKGTAPVAHGMLVTPDLIENAVKVGDSPNLKGGEHPFSYYNNAFIGPDGKKYLAKLNVKDTPDVSRLHYQSVRPLNEITKIESPNGTSFLSESSDLIKGNSNIKVPQKLQDVNGGSQKTKDMLKGEPALADEYIAEYDRSIKSVADYIKGYKPKGTETHMVPIDTYGSAGNYRYSASNNDIWYQDFYRKYGRAPRKSEAEELAKELVDDALARGEGEFLNDHLLELGRAMGNTPPATSDFVSREVLPDPRLPKSSEPLATPAKSVTSTADKSPEALGIVPEGFSENISLVKKVGRKLHTGVISGQSGLERFAKMQDKNTATSVDYAQAVRSSKGTARYIYKEGLVDRLGNKVNGKPYEQLMKQIPSKDLKAFNDYAQNKHNIARMSLDKETQLDLNLSKTAEEQLDAGVTKPDRGKNKPVVDKTADESREIVKAYEEAHPEFKKYSEDITKWWNDFTYEWLVKSGRISKQQWEHMRELYPDYIPTYRVDQRSVDGGGLRNVVTAAKPIKGAVGSTKEIIPLEDSFLTQMEKIVKGTHKNDLYLNLIEDIQKNPDKYATFGRYIGKAEKSAGDDLLGMLDDVDLENLKEVKDGVYRLTAYKNGEARSVYINKDLKDSLTLLDDPFQNEYIRAASGVGKTLTTPVKAVTTGINPFFALANMMRDFPTYLIHSEANMAKASSSLVKSLYQILTKGDVYKQYKAMGGGQAGYYTQGKGFSEAMKRDTLPSKIRGAMIKPFELLGETSETIPRLAEYMNAISKYGDTPSGRIKARQAAADVTVNFSRTAPVTKALDGWVLYLNAAVQGLDKFARQVKSKPGRTVGRAATLITLPQIALYMKNKDNPHYQDLDERTKQNYYVIPNMSDLDENGYAQSFIKVPLTREYGAIFGSSLDVMADMMEGKENPMKGYKESFMTSFAPPTEGAWAPVVHNLPQNKDFAGRAIVPMGMENLDPEYQKDYKTSGAAEAIAKGAKNLGIPSDALKSPMKVDYIMGAYGGGAAQALKGATSQQNQDGGDRFRRAAIEPLERRFTANPLYQSGVVSDFYDEKNAAERAVNNEKYGKGVPSEYKTPNDKVNSIYTAASKAMSDLRKEERALLISGKSKDEIKKRSDEIRKEINEIARNTKAEAQKAKKEYEKTYIPEISNMSDHRQQVYRDAQRRIGLKPDEYAELFTKLDLNGNNSISQDEAKKVLDGYSLTNKQKSIIWNAINASWKTNPYK